MEGNQCQAGLLGGSPAKTNVVFVQLQSSKSLNYCALRSKFSSFSLSICWTCLSIRWSCLSIRWSCLSRRCLDLVPLTSTRSNIALRTLLTYSSSPKVLSAIIMSSAFLSAAAGLAFFPGTMGLALTVGLEAGLLALNVLYLWWVVPGALYDVAFLILFVCV